jgi:hypothetical protein
MMKPALALLSVLALAACGGSSKQAATPETAPLAETAPLTEPETAPAAEGTLTEAQCTEAIDHAIVLVRANPDMAGLADGIEADKATHVADCLKTGTQKDYDCLMAAKSFEEMGMCEEPGK